MACGAKDILFFFKDKEKLKLQRQPSKQSTLINPASSKLRNLN